MVYNIGNSSLLHHLYHIPFPLNLSVFISNPSVETALEVFVSVIKFSKFRYIHAST